ncbi:Glu-tRNA(Gln) amidotransferase subunit GatE [Candidatus Woesearchaeota archaeon]|nr:Glu-tRNA(Gln) amidotransferase subunit GatE [Candidatus Woesearchaeota archaeon]
MEIDYEKMGLRCGLEIHQQLNTHKLFCTCPSQLRDDPPDVIVKRKLRASAGETGSIDIAAQHEMAKQKTIVYEGYTDTTCLVEFDEEPPQPMNTEALAIALQVASLLHAMVVDQIQVMRKIVVDGSNTTGFQRTALIALNGTLQAPHGKVAIPTICIEEESAKIIQQDASTVIYRLDRLGIPLIEIATDPSITSPLQAREVAEELGMILRSTGKVRRGLGTIRQDLNISIRDGARVEIKGAQNLKLLPMLVEYECIRQRNLLELKQALHATKIMREAQKTIASATIYDLTPLLQHSSSNVIQSALHSKGGVYGLPLRGFKGNLGKELQPGRRLGTELADYARVHSGVKGLFHADELPGYGITPEEVTLLRKKLSCAANDGFILIADQHDRAQGALDIVRNRIIKCFEGIPQEVRRANEDGTSTYLRPMPGSARLYPETDVQPFIPQVTSLELPELIRDKIQRYVITYKISNDSADQMAKRGIQFDAYVSRFSHIKPQLIAEVFTSYPKEIKTRYAVTFNPFDQLSLVEDLFVRLDKGELEKEALFEILVQIAQGKQVVYEQYKPLSRKELEQEIGKIITAHPQGQFNVLMGKIMAKYRGKVDGKEVAAFLKQKGIVP